MLVRDDPLRPDPGFAELYDRLPPATDLEPWLRWCREAEPPVLYAGIGTGRLAAPMVAAGVQLVGLDAHAGMLERLRRRLPSLEIHQGPIEEADLGRCFDLLIAPSSLLNELPRLRGAARLVAPGGRIGLELMNPHWLRAGADAGVRLLADDGDRVSLEVDYRLPGGEIWTQQVDSMSLVEPGRVEAWLAEAGLDLLWLGGTPGLGLDESPTFFALAGLTARRR